VPKDDGDRSIDREVRAQVHYWASQAFSARGETASATSELESARKLVDSLADGLPESMRARFRDRPEIGRILR